VENRRVTLVFEGRPLVQKNNNVIRRKKLKSGKVVPFVAHSDNLTQTRTRMSLDLFVQYRKLGFVEPIDYLCTATLVFYVPRKSEPDIDNLPGIVFDAMQGAAKNSLGKILVDDKLVRQLNITKLVEGDVRYYGEPRSEITIEPWLE